MVKSALNVEDKCQNCHLFSPYVDCTKMYGGTALIETTVHIYCEHRDICDQVEDYLEERING